MCNKLHVGYKEIAPEGKAYKLVRQRWLGRWMALTAASTYKENEDGWIKWENWWENNPRTFGFCLIPTLKGAIRTHEVWEGGLICKSSSKIVEVEYRQGLGRFFEDLFIGGHSIDVMLAREFKIIGEVK